MSEWYQRCAACDAFTCPAERERRACTRCGADPRSPRERLAYAVWYAAVVVAIPLAMPAIAVTLLGLSAWSALKGDAP